MSKHRISSLTSSVMEAEQLLATPNDNRLFIDVRLGEPADIARAVSFLAGPSAAYITGETLHVNGGMYMP